MQNYPSFCKIRQPQPPALKQFEGSNFLLACLLADIFGALNHLKALAGILSTTSLVDGSIHHGYGSQFLTLQLQVQTINT